MTRSTRAATGLLAVLLVAVGCGAERPPAPEIVEIRVLTTPGRVVYNGEEMGAAEAERELQYLATDRRHSVTQAATGVRVVIVAPGGANDRRARELSRYCMGIGLNMIQFQAR